MKNTLHPILDFLAVLRRRGRIVMSLKHAWSILESVKFSNI